MLSFVGKYLTQKMSVHFLYFYLNEEKLNQQVCLIKYVENEISNSTSHKRKPTNKQTKKKKKNERSKNNQSNFKKFIFKTSAKLPLVK